MSAKAPTPAPNRRADGTLDPDYKKPLAPAAVLRLLANPGMLIYFLRKKGTTDHYYQRRGGRQVYRGGKWTQDPKWGLMATAACWTSPNGPRPVKGSDGEIVSFQLGEEIV